MPKKDQSLEEQIEEQMKVVDRAKAGRPLEKAEKELDRLRSREKKVAEPVLRRQKSSTTDIDKKIKNVEQEIKQVERTLKSKSTKGASKTSVLGKLERLKKERDELVEVREEREGSDRNTDDDAFSEEEERDNHTDDDRSAARSRPSKSPKPITVRSGGDVDDRRRAPRTNGRPSKKAHEIQETQDDDGDTGDEHDDDSNDDDSHVTSGDEQSEESPTRANVQIRSRSRVSARTGLATGSSRSYREGSPGLRSRLDSDLLSGIPEDIPEETDDTYGKIVKWVQKISLV